MQLALLPLVSERDRILATLAGNHRQYLELVRALARDIARRDGVVSIDDVREELERRDLPMPSDIGADTRVFGALFRGSDWVAIGQHPTRRADRIARAGIGASHVTAYRLRGASCGR